MRIIELKKYFIASLAVAGLALAPTSHAQSLTVVTISGGNASSAWTWNQVTNAFGGAGTVKTVGSTSSSTVRSFQGTLAGLPNYPSVNVELDFILNGAVGGLQDITFGNVETNALGGYTNTPTLVISSTTPDAVGLSSSGFNEAKSLVAPYAFVRNPLTSGPGLVTVSNLTQRQAAYLEGSAGTNFHSAYIGGSSTSDSVYLVGRNTASAVRTETDATIYFTGSLETYTTNSAGQPILDPAGGQSSGSNIRILLSLITNSIGTVALQDVKTNIPLNFEGYSLTPSNVIYGNYPLWGYEHYYWLNSGGAAGREIAGEDGPLVAEVPREADGAEILVLGGQFLQLAPGRVGAVVVGEDKFDIVVGHEGGEPPAHLAVAILDIQFLVEDRDDNGDEGAAHAFTRLCRTRG